MKLQTTNLAENADRFSSIWGYYVTGFNYQEHCQKCLRGKRETKLDTYVYDEPLELLTEYKYFYLCALGKPRSADSNVQFVVTPRPGAVASVGSLYGAAFTIQDALSIRVNGLPMGWRGLGKEFTQCPNFQFGVQTYGYPSSEKSLDFGPALLTQKSVLGSSSQ